MMAKDKIRFAALKISISLERGQRLGFHNFRHSLATFLINKGKDVKAIQGLLRHAKASTTLDLYSQAIDASKLEAQQDAGSSASRGLANLISPKTTAKLQSGASNFPFSDTAL